MADFLTAHKITQKVEGGYAFNPKDRGGETYKGIARNIWASWAGWRIVDMLRISQSKTFPACLDGHQVLQELILKFYRQNFWDFLSLDKVKSQSVANELYDTAVNMGPSVAGKFLQEALNVYNLNQKRYADMTVDGEVGPKTLTAVNSLDAQGTRNVYKMLNSMQGVRYMTICKNDPTQEAFMPSWFSRVYEDKNPV